MALDATDAGSFALVELEYFLPHAVQVSYNGIGKCFWVLLDRTVIDAVAPSVREDEETGVGTEGLELLEKERLVEHDEGKDGLLLGEEV